MTTTQLDHLRKIDAHLEHLLEIAAKRTPGRWKTRKGSRHGCDVETSQHAIAQCDFNGDSEDDSEDEDNAAYIAACSDNAEAGWKSTRGMIRTLLELNKAMEGGKPGFVLDAITLCHDALLEVVLSQWSLESLLQTAKV